jgi:hypothetical protein
MNETKRVISLFVAMLFIFSTVFQVYGQTISDLKNSNLKYNLK